MVPVVLGCCPHEPRCLICPPPDPPAPETVAALIEHYRTERAGPSEALQVRFFGGAPPTDAQLEAAQGLPISVRVRPDLLSRADAARLQRAGCTEIELDALSFHPDILREAGRTYKRGLLEEQTAGLQQAGLRVGGVLAPGLPRSSHETSLADARIAAGLWDFARIHPVLVLAGSRLRELHSRNRYKALELAEAVTTCLAMLEILEADGVAVRRIGLQPGPDGFGRAVAGPRHSGLRELVEARRTLGALRQRMHFMARPETAVVITCAPADETRTRGPLQAHVRALRAEFELADLVVETDPQLPRGSFTLREVPT